MCRAGQGAGSAEPPRAVAEEAAALGRVRAKAGARLSSSGGAVPSRAEPRGPDHAVLHRDGGHGQPVVRGHRRLRVPDPAGHGRLQREAPPGQALLQRLRARRGESRALPASPHLAPRSPGRGRSPGTSAEPCAAPRGAGPGRAGLSLSACLPVPVLRSGHLGVPSPAARHPHPCPGDGQLPSVRPWERRGSLVLTCDGLSDLALSLQILKNIVCFLLIGNV